MKKIQRLFFAIIGLVVTLSAVPITSQAIGAAPKYGAPSGLIIGQLKITGDEYIVLQNNAATTINDLSAYWLYAYNKTNPSDAATSSSGEQLPSGRLEAGQTILLSSKAHATCGATIAGDLSVSFGDSAGYLQLIKQSIDSATLVQSPVDAVSWSSGTTGIISKVPSNTSLPAGTYYRTLETPSGWQLAMADSVNACQLNALVTGTTASTAPPVAGLTAAIGEPPSIILSATISDDDEAVAASIPAADIGLAAPQITELLPNPMGTGNDETDEFIELYNPNDKIFDLSGFVLQSGLNTKHSYPFPVGTYLLPRSFTAFTSADTGLSLSNTSGAADLLDPLGATIAQTDAYGTAKDGMAWARAGGNWVWTLRPSPNAANTIKPPPVKATAKSKSKSSKTSKTTASSTKTTGQSGTTANNSIGNVSQTDALQVTPIHSWTLAAAAVLAVAYGIYEYRLDLANRFYRLRRYYADRRQHRQPTEG